MRFFSTGVKKEEVDGSTESTNFRASTRSKSIRENKALTQVDRSKRNSIAVPKIGRSKRNSIAVPKIVRSKRNSIAVPENKPIDLAVLNNFEDWLNLDTTGSFKINKCKESGSKKLSLEGQLKSPEDADIVPHLVKNDTDLTWLSLTDCKIGRDRCLAVIEALKSNTALKFIGLSLNDIDLDGCLAIKGMLTVNQTLTSIDLKNTNIGDLGFVEIMNAMQSNRTITDLDLRRNNITCEGCHAMRDALQINTTLQKVELRGNSIGDEGCRMIIEGLHNNTTLSKLTMERNAIDADVLQECMAFVECNKTIQCHRNNVDVSGISYYVTVQGVADHKPYLTWATKDSTMIIDEAAKSNQSLALVVFMETLRSIVDSEKIAAQSKLPDSFSPTILKMMRDKKELRKLLNQKINDDTYLSHTIAASKHPDTLDMLKFLIDRCNASFYTVVDDRGHTAQAIALASEDDAKHEWANTHGSFLGRYIIEGGKGKGIKSNPVHKSATSIVYFAHDVTKTENDPKYQVAIKIMKDEETYKRERQVRLNEGESLSTFLSGEDIPISSNRYDTDLIVTLYRFHDEKDITGQHYRCLVFEKDGKNLHQIIDSELIAGNDERIVSYYGRGLAKAIQHVHSKGYIHADIKPRNVIRASNNVLKLIDLDNSIATGKKLTKDFSSAFISPEVARDLYGSKEEDAGSIQEQIIKQQEIMTKLDLSKNDDIIACKVAYEKIQALLASKGAYENAKEPLQASPSVDIWGFGVIMYYLCTGEPLFLYNLNDNLATESEKNRLMTWQGLSRTDLDKVCSTCLSQRFRENSNTFLIKSLHVNPAERFQSMEEILDHDLFSDTDDIGDNNMDPNFDLNWRAQDITHEDRSNHIERNIL